MKIKLKKTLKPKVKDYISRIEEIPTDGIESSHLIATVNLSCNSAHSQVQAELRIGFMSTGLITVQGFGALVPDALEDLAGNLRKIVAFCTYHHSGAELRPNEEGKTWN